MVGRREGSDPAPDSSAVFRPLLALNGFPG